MPGMSDQESAAASPAPDAADFTPAHDCPACSARPAYVCDRRGCGKALSAACFGKLKDCPACGEELRVRAYRP